MPTKRKAARLDSADHLKGLTDAKLIQRLRRSRTSSVHPAPAMHKRSIEWLKGKELNKSFRVYEDKERAHLNEPDFEAWATSKAGQRVAMDWGDGFTADDSGFTYCNQAPEHTYPEDGPFPFIKPVYARYRCPWEHVTAVYEASTGFVYIFTSKEKQTDSDR